MSGPSPRRLGSEDTMAALARAHGFCTEHAEMLLRIDFQM
jgi:hypothetical protein